MRTQKRKTGDIVLLKDLAPREEVKGGAGKIVFGAGADGLFEREEESNGKKKKCLVEKNERRIR